MHATVRCVVPCLHRVTTQRTGSAENVEQTVDQSPSSNLNTFTAAQAYTLYVYGQQGNATQPLSATWVEDYPVQNPANTL